MRVLVTGAGDGLGASLVRLLRSRGDRVLATDLQPPADGPSLRLDICDDTDWRTARAWVEREWGGLDLLINNAGIAGGGRIDVTTIAEWQTVIEVDLLGMVRGLREFVPMLKSQGSGHIVNIASLAGLVHPAGMASYNAAKAGVVALSETLSHELDPWGIRTTVVCPSYFRTGLVAKMQGADRATGTVLGALVDRSPFSPDDIAAAVIAGVERGDEMIFPDAASQAASDLKRTDPAAYSEVMRAQAHKLRDRADG